LSKAILKSTSLVGALTLLSRVTGLLREMVYAQVFGASALMDAFLVAIKIPNFLRRLFAEGSFSQGFVPVISEYRHKKTHEETRELVAGVAGTLGGVLFVVTVIGVVAAPVLPAPVLPAPVLPAPVFPAPVRAPRRIVRSSEPVGGAGGGPPGR